MTIGQFISKLAEDPTKLAALLVSLAALTVSVVSFVLNRRHATRLFRAKQHPEILLESFNVLVPSSALIDILRHGEKRLGFGQQVHDHRAAVCIEFENVTEVKALDLYVRVALIKGLRRVRWRMRSSKWNIVAPLASERANFSGTLNKALVELCPNLLIRRDLGSGQYSEYRWLEFREGARTPRISVLIEIGWRPPLTGAAFETRAAAGILMPELFQKRLDPEKDKFDRAMGTPVDLIGRPVIQWKFAQRRLLTFLKMMYWRPHTSELPDEVFA